jgi:hypothetical protein
MGGCVSPRADLDAMEKKIFCRESNPGCPARSLVTLPTELSERVNTLHIICGMLSSQQLKTWRQRDTCKVQSVLN